MVRTSIVACVRFKMAQGTFASFTWIFEDLTPFDQYQVICNTTKSSILCTETKELRGNAGFSPFYRTKVQMSTTVVIWTLSFCARNLYAPAESSTNVLFSSFVAENSASLKTHNSQNKNYGNIWRRYWNQTTVSGLVAIHKQCVPHFGVCLCPWKTART